MAAGKTYDVEVKRLRPQGAYSAATLALFDRELSLSTNNQRDGGMQSYIAVAGGAASGVGSAAGSGVALAGVASKKFYCVSGTTLSVTDPLSGLLGGATGANGVAVTATSLPGTLTVQSNGTFTYVPPAAPAVCGGSFTYLVNNDITKPVNEPPHTAARGGGTYVNATVRLNGQRAGQAGRRYGHAVRAGRAAEQTAERVGHGQCRAGNAIKFLGGDAGKCHTGSRGGPDAPTPRPPATAMYDCMPPSR